MVNFTITYGGAALPPDLLRWPAFVGASPTLRALLDGLATSQWLSAGALAAGQALQLASLVPWAAAHCPAYAPLSALAPELGAAGANPGRFGELWQQWPVLTKAQLRREPLAPRADVVPLAHQPAEPLRTSGSTGTPVEVATTAVTRAIWNALTAREHLWQARDPGRRLGVIRHRPRKARDPRGEDLPSWGSPMAELVRTGPASVIHVGYPIDVLTAWLVRFDPHYLLTYPSIAAALLDALPMPDSKPPSLEEVRLFSEPLDASLEARLASAWGVRATDMYSANEVGHIAFRCREHGRLHVQAESLCVEILDGAGRPCAVGEPGRVVVTALHNFATPLLRYEIGDIASFGAPCPCGRGLPVLERVMGRVRNLVRTPDGRRYWPVALGKLRELTPVQQAQYVQTHIGTIELRVVASRPLSLPEQAAAVERVREALGYPFEVVISQVAAIERGPTGKFEEFLSLLEP